LILQNRLYRGEVEHKGNVYSGQHEAIVDADLWIIVKEKLAANRKARSLSSGAEAPSLLSGLLFDSDGNRMTPTHANKRGRRYRYYISASLLDRAKPGPNPMRVPASEIDGLVLDRLHALIASRREIADALAQLTLKARELDIVLARADELSHRWLMIPPEELRALTRNIITRVALSVDRIDVAIGVVQLAHALGSPIGFGDEAWPTIVVSIAAELRRAGQGKRMVIGEPYQATTDSSLVDVLQEAFAAKQKLIADTSETLNEITTRTTKSKGRLTALMRLSYLAPDIINDFLAGRQPPELSPKRLLRTSQNLPLEWSAQRAFLRFP
jgi:site-specific DNA recombinase